MDKLNYALRDHQAANRKDRNLEIRYRNYMRRRYYAGRPGFYEEEEEEEMYPARQSVVSEIIQQQNQ